VQIPIHSSDDILRARRAARELADQIGFNSLQRIAIVTAVSELARNVLVHGGGGEVVLDPLPDPGISIVAQDSGSGIVDPQNAFRRGHGLWAVRRAVDELIIEVGPDRKGTRVTARKRVSRRSRRDD
jgi:serine/threonine-protein kinase RsbT